MPLTSAWRFPIRPFEMNVLAYISSETLEDWASQDYISCTISERRAAFSLASQRSWYCVIPQCIYYDLHAPGSILRINPMKHMGHYALHCHSHTLQSSSARYLMYLHPPPPLPPPGGGGGHGTVTHTVLPESITASDRTHCMQCTCIYFDHRSCKFIPITPGKVGVPLWTGQPLQGLSPP